MRLPINRFGLWLVCALSMIVCLPGNSRGHIAEVVFNTGGMTRGRMSAAVDAAGQPHVLFINTMDDEAQTSVVTYATRTDLGWVTETLSTGTIRSAAHSLALDNEGRPHVVLFDVSTYEAIYGTRGETGWSYETVASNTYALAPAIGVDSTGKPHITFAINSSTPQLASRDATGDWVVAPNYLPSQIVYDGGVLDITFDQNDRPFINYLVLEDWGGQNSIIVASPEASLGGALIKYSELQLADSMVRQTDLVIDDDNKLRMMLVNDTSQGPRTYQYIQTPGGWETAYGILDGRREYITASMAVDSQNRTQILRTANDFNAGHSELELFTITGGQAVIEDIAPGLDTETQTPSTYNAIAADDQGGLHMFYNGYSGLRYVYIPEPGTLMIACMAIVSVIGCRRAVG